MNVEKTGVKLHDINNGHYHMNWSIEHTRHCLMIDEMQGRGQNMFCKGGKPITYEQARQYIDKLDQQGYHVIPVCKNQDELGYCTGHRGRKNTKGGG